MWLKYYNKTFKIKKMNYYLYNFKNIYISFIK